jgi:hypothetical protein
MKNFDYVVDAKIVDFDFLFVYINVLGKKKQ